MKIDALWRDPRIQAAGWTPSEWNQVLESAVNVSRLDRIREPERILSEIEISAIFTLAERASQGEPLGYILEHAHFDGLLLSVSPDVLIPRPDTEVLLQAALQCVAVDVPGHLLDVCTGSGALALAFKTHHPSWRVVGSDIAPEAIAVARRNGDRLGVSVEWVVTDLCDGLGQFDVIIANPPYIAIDDTRVELSVSTYEPALALFADNEGLAVIERLLKEARSHLRPEGRLLIEHGPEQHGRIASAARKLGWLEIECRPDLAGRDRVTTMRFS